MFNLRKFFVLVVFICLIVIGPMVICSCKDSKETKKETKNYFNSPEYLKKAAVTIAESEVTGILKLPTTAVFEKYTTHVVAMDNNVFLVTGYVTAETNSGNKFRKAYKVKLKNVGNLDWKLLKGPELTEP